MAEVSEFDRSLRDLKLHFVNGMSARLKLMEELCQALHVAVIRRSTEPSESEVKMSNAAIQAAKELLRLAHSLKGSAQMFGMPLTSQAANVLELTCGVFVGVVDLALSPGDETDSAPYVPGDVVRANLIEVTEKLRALAVVSMTEVQKIRSRDV